MPKVIESQVGRPLPLTPVVASMVGPVDRKEPCGSATSAARSRRHQHRVEPQQPQLPPQRVPRTRRAESTLPELTPEHVYAAMLAADGALTSMPCPPKAQANTVRGTFECAEPPCIAFSAYMRRVVLGAQSFGVMDSTHVAACALALMSRVARTGVLPVTVLTCHRIGLACFVVAHKVNADCPQLLNSAWARIGGVELEDINICEKALLGVLDWNVQVSLREVRCAVNLPSHTIADPTIDGCPVTRA